MNEQKTLMDIHQKASELLDNIYSEYESKPRKPSYFYDVCMLKGYLDSLQNYLPKIEIKSDKKPLPPIHLHD